MVRRNQNFSLQTGACNQGIYTQDHFFTVFFWASNYMYVSNWPSESCIPGERTNKKLRSWTFKKFFILSSILWVLVKMRNSLRDQQYSFSDIYFWPPDNGRTRGVFPSPQTKQEGFKELLQEPSCAPWHLVDTAKRLAGARGLTEKRASQEAAYTSSIGQRKSPAKSPWQGHTQKDDLEERDSRGRVQVGWDFRNRSWRWVTNRGFLVGDPLGTGAPRLDKAHHQK